MGGAWKLPKELLLDSEECSEEASESLWLAETSEELPEDTVRRGWEHEFSGLQMKIQLENLL